MATAKFYGNFLKTTMAGGTSAVDWDGDTIKIALTTSTYTPDQDTHDFYDDVTNVVAASGTYPGGGASGQTLSLSAPTYDSTTNEVRLKAASDVTWTGTTLTARYAVIYKWTGTASTSTLIGYIDFGTDQTTSAGTFAIAFDSTSGIGKITVS